jgi:hypothetical protein
MLRLREQSSLLDGHPAMIHPKSRDLAVILDFHDAEVSLFAGFEGPDAVGSAQCGPR